MRLTTSDIFPAKKVHSCRSLEMCDDRTSRTTLRAMNAVRLPLRRIRTFAGAPHVPFLTGRLIRLASERKDPRMPDGPLPILRKYHYEVAQGNTPGQLAALMKLVTISQVLFGSDYPYRPGTEAVDGVRDYGFSVADVEAIDRGNALAMLPGIKAG